MQRSILRRSRLAIVAIAVGALTLTACAAASSGGSKAASSTTGAFGTLPAASGTPIKGGTITYPVTNGSTPTYIMPILPGKASTVYNQMFQYLMYRPLYYSSIGNRPVPNPTLSLAAPPTYSNGNKTVTINMKHSYTWADGKPVDAQDVLFFIDELRAAVHPVSTNAANFGNYTPGDFPDNVVSATAPSQFQVVLKLDRAYNPNWFTQTQLSLITPMPSTAWNIAAAGGPPLDFTNPANAKKIYTFLDAEAGKLSTYGSNPLWKVADGPFQLESFTSSTGANTMVANPHYGGPQKPVFDKLQALSFTSLTAEFNAILAGKINQGIIPSADIPQIAKVKAAGYNVYGYPNLGFEYTVFNFKDTTDHWDKIIGQLYVRQALAHLQDQEGIIKGVFNGAAAPAYGPVPAVPATNYVPADAATNPYPYSIAAASKLLSDHGWTVRPGGTTTCTSPGTAANQCGEGIPAGANINFTDFYTNDPATAGLETTQLASAAAKIGIKVTPVAKTFNFIVNQYDDPIAPANNNKWKVENYGGFTEYPYPTTDTIFNTKGSNNEGGYSSPEADRLIKASKFSADPNAVEKEAAFLTKDLPGIFGPNGDLIYAWKGISGPPDSFSTLTQYSFIPEYWYLTSSK